MAPKLSVITPMYNAEAYIEQAVTSVLNQTITDFEYLIVNDASTDQSAKIIAQLATTDARIKLIQAPHNLGAASAANLALSQAQGEYIALMDADDMCRPHRFAKQLATLAAQPETVLVACQYQKIDAHGKTLRKTRNNLRDAALRFHLLFGVPVCHPTIMFKRTVLTQLGHALYNPTYQAAADYDFMLRVAKIGELDVVPDYLFSYRVNPQGLSKRKKDIVLQESLALALPNILNQWPDLASHQATLTTFLRLQLGDRPSPLTQTDLTTYTTGLRLLYQAYKHSLKTPAQKRQVALFATELELKTVLFRLKAYRNPFLCSAWLISLLKYWGYALINVIFNQKNS